MTAESHDSGAERNTMENFVEKSRSFCTVEDGSTAAALKFWTPEGGEHLRYFAHVFMQLTKLVTELESLMQIWRHRICRIMIQYGQSVASTAQVKARTPQRCYLHSDEANSSWAGGPASSHVLMRMEE